MVKDLKKGPEIGQRFSAFGEQQVAQPTAKVLAHFPYNLNSDIVTTTTAGSGAVTHSNQFAVIASGAATSSSGKLNTNRTLEYNPGIGGLARFTTIFGTGTAGNTQISGIGNTTDGFFFGYNGTQFGILYRAGGSDTWIPQTSWNGNRMLGNERFIQTLDPQKGNVYQIQYQWLGFGAIRFYIEDNVSGSLELVHTIRYANENTSVSVNNPTFPFCAESANTTNNTDIQMKISSIGLFVEGKETNAGDTRNAIDNEKTISTTETNILTIRNKSTYQSVTNAVIINPDFLTLASDGTKNVTVRIYANTTLGGTPSYTDISTNTSVVDYDTAGTTITGGTLLAVFELAKVDSLSQSFKEFNFLLFPGQTMTFAAVSAANNDVSVGISWAERFK